MARKRKRSGWHYALWAGGLVGLAMFGWLGWQIVAPASSQSRRVLASVALFVAAVLIFGPEVFEITSRRAIRRTCQAAGESVTKIESRKTHYRVFIQTNSGLVSRKCVVHSGEVKWISSDA
jgi:hypothetical protein